MPRKGAKCPLAWTLLDENIENVEQLRLEPDEQRELGCVVGEHVFLEYPWAFAPRDAVLALSRKPGSALEGFRQRIEAYETCAFLIGYSSRALSARDFVICLGDEATRAVIARNRRITRAILQRVLKKMASESVEPWKSRGSQVEISESFVETTRNYFEINVLLRPECIGLDRQLSDESSAGERNHVELVAREEEGFENVKRKCISRQAQTHLTPRPIEIQTYSDYARTAWTQYGHDDTFDRSDIDSSEDASLQSKNDDADTIKSERKNAIGKTDEEVKPTEKTPLEQFLESCSTEMMDIVKYNTVVNLHVDDIRCLSESELENKATVHPAHEQLLSLIAFSAQPGKAVSSVCWCPELKDHLVISYTTGSPKTNPINVVEKFKFESAVLIWSLNDPLHPSLELQDFRDIHSIACCPDTSGSIIGGCCTGQVVVWNIRDHLAYNSHSRVKNSKKPASLARRNGVVRPIFVSDKCHSHRLPVRSIEWMPANYRIEPTGNLTKLADRGSVQFLTASEDGTVAVWDLPTCPNSSDGSSKDAAFRPIFKINIRLPDQSANLCVLALCLPSLEVFQERNPAEQRRSALNPEEEDYLKSLWIGTRRGLVRCMWEGQVLDVLATGIGECKLLNHSEAHDGPVREIFRSPHLRDVLLTIGGHVFAIWKDDYLDTPLFWRRSCAFYTSCTWANRPGVIFIGRDDGELEIWDLKKNSNEPVGIQTISEKAITCLILLESSAEGHCLIGAGDAAGVFRVLKDPVDYSFDTVLGKLDWFEEYIWKEVRRKRVFRNWQDDYLSNDPTVLAKKAAQQAEQVRQKQEEARAKLQGEHEERLRMEAKRKELSVPKSKDVLWRSSNIERMERILLRKKGLARAELEEKRLPLLDFERKRHAKLSKAQDKVALRGERFKEAVATEFPEIFNNSNETKEEEESIEIQGSLADFVKQYEEIREQAREMLNAHTTKKE